MSGYSNVSSTWPRWETGLCRSAVRQIPRNVYIYILFTFLDAIFLNVKMQNVEIQKYTLFLGKNWYFANHRAPLVGQRGARFHETYICIHHIHFFLIFANPFSETRNNKQLKHFRDSGHLPLLRR